jgi:hypothetical protein
LLLREEGNYCEEEEKRPLHQTREGRPPLGLELNLLKLSFEVGGSIAEKPLSLA